MKNGHRGSKFGPEVHLNGLHKVNAPFLNILFFCDSVGENTPKIEKRRDFPLQSRKKIKYSKKER